MLLFRSKNKKNNIFNLQYFTLFVHIFVLTLFFRLETSMQSGLDAINHSIIQNLHTKLELLTLLLTFINYTTNQKQFVHHQRLADITKKGLPRITANRLR